MTTPQKLGWLIVAAMFIYAIKQIFP